MYIPDADFRDLLQDNPAFPNRYIVVNPRSGKLLGQLVPCNSLVYAYVARCNCNGHEQCTRMRRWKVDDEEIEQVLKSLVRWLTRGQACAEKAREQGQSPSEYHMQLPRE